MKRIEWLLANRRPWLEAGLHGEPEETAARLGEAPKSHLALLAEADPTPRGRFLEVLLRWHGHPSIPEARRLRLADVRKARGFLEDHLSRRPTLPSDRRDPGRFEDFPSFCLFVGSLVEAEPVPSRSKRSGKGRTRSVAIEGLDILYEDGGGRLIAIPRTVSAAKYLGKGTRWCTSSDGGGNQFETYAAFGDLLVIVDSEGRKYQAQKGSSSFDDAWSHPVDFDDMVRLASLASLSPEAVSAFRGTDTLMVPLLWREEDGIDEAEIEYWMAQERRVLGLVPPERLTGDLCRMAIETSPFSVLGIPERFRADEMLEPVRRWLEEDGVATSSEPGSIAWLETVSKSAVRSGLSLREIPDAFRTMDVCAAALIFDPKAFRDLPDGFKTEAAAMLAAASSWRALPWIPEELLVPSVVSAFARHFPEGSVPTSVEVESWREENDAAADEWFPVLDLEPSHSNSSYEQKRDALRSRPGDRDRFRLRSERLLSSGSSLYSVADRAPETSDRGRKASGSPSRNEALRIFSDFSRLRRLDGVFSWRQ